MASSYRRGWSSYPITPATNEEEGFNSRPEHKSESDPFSVDPVVTSRETAAASALLFMHNMRDGHSSSGTEHDARGSNRRGEQTARDSPVTSILPPPLYYLPPTHALETDIDLPPAPLPRTKWPPDISDGSSRLSQDVKSSFSRAGMQLRPPSSSNTGFSSIKPLISEDASEPVDVQWGSLLQTSSRIHRWPSDLEDNHTHHTDAVDDGAFKVKRKAISTPQSVRKSGPQIKSEHLGNPHGSHDTDGDDVSNEDPIMEACDACGRQSNYFLSKISRTTSLTQTGFIRINPDTGLHYNVCVNCWDKVKNSHSGCRLWIHREIEKTHRGLLERTRAAMHNKGVAVPEHDHYAEIFYQTLDKYLQVRNLHSTHILKNLKVMTYMHMSGMKYNSLSSKRAKDTATSNISKNS